MRLLEFATGTYSAFQLNEDSADELYEFCKGLGIDELVDPSDYHCTLLYSKKPCPNIESEDYGLPCTGQPISYKILGTDQPVLVLVLKCKTAAELHSLFVNKHGGTHDYDEYIPHITIAKNYVDTDVPTDIPKFDIIFTDKIVEEITDD